MKKFSLLLIFTAMALCLKAQESLPDLDIKQGNEKTTEQMAPDQKSVATIVETNASFPGGISAMVSFIQKNMQYPQEARDAGIDGKCFLKFIINENGSISDIVVLKGVPGCPACDKEAVRVVSIMPVWQPAALGGRKVKCYFNLPISFRISNGKK